MKSTISTVFDNRLITSSNFISLKLVDNSVVCTLQNTFYTKYAEDAESARTLFETASNEFAAFSLNAIEPDYLINIDAITGASMSVPTLANVKYTVYILFGKSKICICKDTEQEALDFLASISALINSQSSGFVTSVSGEMVDNTDASNPVVGHDDIKLDSALIETEDHRYLIDTRIETKAGCLYVIKNTYYNIETKEQEVETIDVVSDTLQAVLVEDPETHNKTLSINVKE